MDESADSLELHWVEPSDSPPTGLGPAFNPCNSCGYGYGKHALDCPELQTVRNNQQSRITVLLKVYYERPDRPAHLVDPSWSINCQSKDQPFFREDLETTVTWARIDTGWVKVPELVIVQNTGQNYLIIGYDSPAGVIPAILVAPGTAQQLTPYNLPDMRITSEKDSTTYNLHAIPK